MEPSWTSGRFEPLEVHSRGAQGEELRARDRMLGREVILVRRTGESALLGKAATERALREARALAGLRHASIQKLHDVVEDADGPMLVLEPVPGETLAARLTRESRLPLDQACRLGIELADALAAVHAAGAVHRDVSEENVILRTDGSACLAGFRLAKPAVLGATSIRYDASTGLAGSSERVLLPAHPAPEQLAGESANARTDLYALGCVLHRALSGRAYSASRPSDVPRSVRGTARLVWKVVLSCLAPSPMGRPQTAGDLRDALRAALAGAEGAGPPRRPSGRRLALALGLLVALGALGWMLRPRGPRTLGVRGLSAEGAFTRPADAGYGSGFRSSQALLIGIGEAYRGNGFEPLANAVRDVEALAGVLESSVSDGWRTRLLIEDEATYDGIRAALSELENELEPEDRALIYFAGHGVPHEHSDASGFLIPADGQSLDRDPLRSRWLHFEALKAFLTDVRAKHVLLAMDCCFGGRMASMRSAEALEYHERFLQSRAVVVLAAGRANERVSDGGAGGHSPFAAVFLDALRPGRGALTSSMIHAQMLRHFTDRHLPQTPVLSYPEDVAPNEFVFLLGP